MNRRNRDIKDQFGFYEDLVHGEKIVFESPIFLDVKANNPHWLAGKSEVAHESIDDGLTLLVERSNREKKYGIKLRCNTLTKEPFFRFDSDGPAHRNDDPSVPLDEQSISTPHFNAFNQDGMPIAYKTEQLKSEKDAEAIINDINFGLAHFCSETNMTHIDREFPEIEVKAPKLQLEESDELFKGVEFP